MGNESKVADPEPIAPSSDKPGDVTPPPSKDGTPKLEMKDGGMVVGGRKVVYESDLIAAKESLSGASDKAQVVHNDAMDKAKLSLSEAQQQLAASNAKNKELTDAQGVGATSVEEVARIKQEAVTAKSSAESSGNKVLELRRANIVLQYQIPAEQLKEKTLEQLDSFAEALKAVAGIKGGVGPYAVGGGGGQAVPRTETERALALLEATPIRGTRNDPVPAK